ncbi:MAG TPA: epoxyalkane--coenzyme M transferase, partial [Stellaceae bacterium]|nr:epoxyalkane--coenzyme M transferase [Stellaceae bacterium]
TGWDMITPEPDLADYKKFIMVRIEALNHALRDLPSERVRHHTCYGINMGPRTSDLELKHLADLIVTIRAGYYSFEMANPRHEHEWRVWESVKLPPGKVLIPGVISHATNIVEHPELVAERVVRLARLVGRENVIASTDCGFAQGPFHRRVHPTIQWAKLKALAEGARIATKALWGR